MPAPNPNKPFYLRIAPPAHLVLSQETLLLLLSGNYRHLVWFYYCILSRGLRAHVWYAARSVWQAALTLAGHALNHVKELHVSPLHYIPVNNKPLQWHYVIISVHGSNRMGWLTVQSALNTDWKQTKEKYSSVTGLLSDRQPTFKWMRQKFW